MLLENTSDRVYRTEEFGHLEVAPGATVELADGYCRPGLNTNGTRRPSIVEQLAPCLKPVDPLARASWGHDTAPAPVLEPTVAQVQHDLEEHGTPPAVAELIAPAKKRGRPRKVTT